MKTFFLVWILVLPSLALSKTTSKTDMQIIKDTKKAAMGQNPFTCKGSFSQLNILSKVGYTDEALKLGIPCEEADFDGNKVKDYFFNKCDKNLKCISVVVLVDKTGISKPIYLKQLSLLEVLNVKEKSFHQGLKNFGCEIPSLGAVVKMGEGDGNDNIIYILNKNQTEFKEFSRCTTIESFD